MHVLSTLDRELERLHAALAQSTGDEREKILLLIRTVTFEVINMRLLGLA